ncbi:MAG: type II toxin-antitoxin system RelE/ParE family toxin [Gammaproteobacteria bacterium]|nr:type II toxin-antitoxin system RelE/ParE family toxin [Gammaproteobacteria bacterium]
MGRDTRPIVWVRAARKVYERFPATVQDRVNTALTIAAEGSKTDIAKPLKGLGSGIMEIAIRYRTDAYRVVYVTKIVERLWVIHAFQKKSKIGSRTPKVEIDLIRERLKQLKREFPQ